MNITNRFILSVFLSVKMTFHYISFFFNHSFSTLIPPAYTNKDFFVGVYGHILRGIVSLVKLTVIYI